MNWNLFFAFTSVVMCAIFMFVWPNDPFFIIAFVINAICLHEYSIRNKNRQ